MPVERVLLAQPRGFCAGVEMAIKALATMLRLYGAPVYCYHEIVHNEAVVNAFRELGVVFVDEIADVPDDRPIMLSAHGSAPEVVAAARTKGSVVVNAVCPLVTKVHHELKVRADQGYEVLYVGHAGHEEAVGTMAVAPESVSLVQSVDDLSDVHLDGPVALLAQTTLAHSEWADILENAREQFPDLWMPHKSDLCYATTNRQAVVKQLAPNVDTLIVIGSENSSNTMALVRTAKEAGAPRVIRINSATQLPADLSGNVGVTSGASAPDHLVNEVISALAPQNGVEYVSLMKEDEYFPLPRELRELLIPIETLASFAFGAPAPKSSGDRHLEASELIFAKP